MRVATPETEPCPFSKELVTTGSAKCGDLDMWSLTPWWFPDGCLVVPWWLPGGTTCVPFPWSPGPPDDSVGLSPVVGHYPLMGDTY